MTERTATGSRPSQRSGHAMAFDGKRGRVLLFGGLDVSDGGARSNLWELDPTTFAWSERLTGAEAGMPAPRSYASLVSDDSGGLLELVAGVAADSPSGSGGSAPGPITVGSGWRGTREVWELDPAKPALSRS